MSNNTEFSDGFVHSFLSILSRDKSRLAESLEYLSPEYLEGDDPIHQIVAAQLQFFFRQYGRVPDKTELLNEVETEAAKILSAASNGLGASQRRYVRRLFKVKVTEPSDIVEKFQKFCRRKRLIEAIEDFKTETEEGGEEGGIEKIRRALLPGSSDLERNFISLPDQVEKSYPDRDEEDRKAPTGFPSLDKLMYGGLPVPGLGVFMAPPKGHKTASMVRIVQTGIKNGAKIAFVSMELSEIVLTRRIISASTGVHLGKVCSGRRSRYASRKFEGLCRKSGADVKIKRWAPRTATVDHIRSWLWALEAKEDFRPDILVVDYADYLRAAGKSKALEERFIQMSVYDQLLAFSDEIKCPVWTATLANRAALGKRTPKMDSISESWAKCAVADIIIAVCRTDQERRKGLGRLFVAGSRISESERMIDIKISKRTLRMIEDPIKRSRKEEDDE